MNWIAEVKNKLNITDVIRDEGITLKPEGGNSFGASCPFHSERTPSFKVSEDYQYFRCWGCGEKGDVLTFYAKRHSITRMEAAELFAQKLGIKVNESLKFTKYQRQLKICKDLEVYLKDNFSKLGDNHPAKVEITRRGLSYSEDFGFAPDSPTELIKYMTEKKQYTIEELKEIGFISEKGAPQQRNRLMFFIRDYMGNTVGFTGRALGENAEHYKYVNSKQSDIYNKSNCLYNIENAKQSARKKGYIYIVEGQFDVVAMKQHGFENTIAISGSALSKKQVLDIKKAVGEEGRVILVLDGDSAGQKATRRIFQENPDLHGFLYTISIPNNEDPCDYLQKNIKLPKAHEYIQQLYTDIRKRHNLDTPQDRNDFLSEVEKEICFYIKKTVLKNEYSKQAHATIGATFTPTQAKTVSKVMDKKDSKISPSDALYVASLGVYLSFPNVVQVEKNNYPDKYSNFVDALINDSKKPKIVSEEYKQSKLADAVLESALSCPPYLKEPGREQEILYHYRSLLRRATKLSSLR